MAKQQPETLELTEMLVIHGDSLRGADREREAKLERIKEALREKGVDFVDQPDALEVWVGIPHRDDAIRLLESMGYRIDLYEIG